jgi:hypothetical protein
MNKRHTLLVLLNTISFIIMLYVNYASNTHVFNEVSVADISHKYDTLFAPAGYAFLIWPVIYLLCTGFIIYQWVLLKDDRGQYIKRTGIWFTVSNITNALWCYCWVNEWLGWCVVFILLLLVSLLILVIRLRLELDDEPVLTIFLVWWPIVFYCGWIITATVACIASWLVFTGWNGFKISNDVWAVIMIAVALFIYIFLISKRNMREAAIVGIWAFIAIAVRQWNSYKDVAFAAIIASVILMILAALHANKNKYYAPFAKIKRGEWK